MATTARQSKTANRKGPAEPTATTPAATPVRRTAAWGTGARASTTFSSTNATGPRQQQPQQTPAAAAAPPSFPPLAQSTNSSAAPRDRVLQALSGLTGTTITLVAKTGQRYEGVISSTTGEGDASGVSLKDVKDVASPGAPLKDSLFIASTNIESYTSGPADSRPDTFRTDADISKRNGPGAPRDLQAWVPSEDISHHIGGLNDDDTFGPSANGGSTSWDQFSVNEQLFGVKATFNEDAYTTKLDRSAPDFKEREKKAQKIANEIIGVATNNPHIAEERGLQIDDSGVNEEDKYGAVVRGQNAYVPPGARKPGAPVPATNNANVAAAPESGAATTKVEVPKVSVNGPDGIAVTAVQAQSPPSSKATSPAPPGSAAGSKPPADPLPAFQAFVKDEKQRLTQKRQALVKSEMDKRMAELVKFSQSFKLNKPIPDDLVPILAKDEERQKQIKEKAKTDAASAEARAIGPSTPATASRGVAVAKIGSGAAAAKVVGAAVAAKVGAAGERKPVTQALAGKGGAGVAAAAAAAAAAGTTQKTTSATNTANPTPSPAPGKTSTSTATTPSSAGATKATTGTKKISMVIQSIPPFRGSSAAAVNKPKAPAPVAAAAAAGSSSSSVNANGSAGPSNANGNGPNAAMSPVSPSTAAANRLNVNASSFRPNLKATSSPKTGPATPASGPTSHSASPKPKSDSAPVTPNPFFGTRPIKKSTPVHVKDDFNPFKHNKVVDASQISAQWPYSGKRYMQMFPPPQHPQNPQNQQQQHQGAHMVPPVPQPMVQPTYEEDPAQAAQQQQQQQQQQQHRGGYVYAYPPYGYPPQHMMPGMGPPGPPGAYMPGPYMQHMPYPPGMPPPNAMYSPAMGQMPPPGYMQPPPPGAYPPPPPNGVGPRPSMPPTPVPSHAHPYYHQSPQLQHAYPMMMPPPPNIPPHGYEGGPAPPPPVPMGGHA